MNSLVMNFLLGLGVVIGLLCHSACGRTGGFVQTSFISTDGGVASGAAESSVTGIDGTKKGECSYTSTNGDYISVKYEESRDGQIISGKTNGDESKASVQNSLAECRASIGKLQQSYGQTVEETNDRIAQFENTFQNQMEAFNQQQQMFAQQQTSFFRQMQDFTRGFMLWK